MLTRYEHGEKDSTLTMTDDDGNKCVGRVEYTDYTKMYLFRGTLQLVGDNDVVVKSKNIVVCNDSLAGIEARLEVHLADYKMGSKI